MTYGPGSNGTSYPDAVVEGSDGWWTAGAHHACLGLTPMKFGVLPRYQLSIMSHKCKTGTEHMVESHFCPKSSFHYSKSRQENQCIFSACHLGALETWLGASTLLTQKGKVMFHDMTEARIEQAIYQMAGKGELSAGVYHPPLGLVHRKVVILHMTSGRMPDNTIK